MSSLYLFAIVSTVLSVIFTPIVKKIALKLQIIDVPEGDRRIHSKPTPLLGGLSIYASFVITLLLKKGSFTREEVGLVLGATIIVIGGFLDDKFDIKPRYKLIFQIAASIILIIYGVKIVRITNPFDSLHQFTNVGVMSIPLTIIWVVGITNALNLIDGLDGLASGIGLISSLTILIIALLNNRYEPAILAIILCGSILGFLPYNFNPASIFMGDTGAQLLGFLLASISIEGAIKSAAAFSIAVPILALGIPIYDTLFAVIRRKINGKPIMQADRGHLHHRLLDMGFSQKQAVGTMYAISAVLGSFSIIAMEINAQLSYFLLAIIMVVLVFIAWRAGFFEHRD
ncbi:MraY family glycosyltransferase [Clostridium kluyveri]|uniref:Undecaprenyl-phosphate alpha-N-acetylglucosaminyl 1-phosphate transferase n=1 Tax=Clostridium kluyveri TaxID=1534 RepID=A0A1L5FDF0_CLOKL|nr:MraY family glycosyltransferase [Clostridium kluyveri]APM41007.1 undecaprenyl-phosphate alpha-N-acetylglucosaminyl 1-phosphate transferase [Clostridium kluyveri]UZQ48713.1 undecaprenyl/decaprenyl-phosphate alpha-N-acetylglucosaminyl 1-phosphate transferase [Clostridium kluyveri]